MPAHRILGPNECKNCGHLKYRDRRGRWQCTSCSNARTRRWAILYPRRYKVRKARQYQRRKINSPHLIKLVSQRYQSKLKLEVISAYGGKCTCCGESNLMFLTLDHIHGNGAKHRKEIGRASKLYRWLRKNGFPDIGLQVLCCNCNWGRFINKGICPHKEPKVIDKFIETSVEELNR